MGPGPSRLQLAGVRQRLGRGMNEEARKMEHRTLLAQPGLWSTDTSWALLYLLCYVLPQTSPQVLRIGE